jgi:hypothetical protein
VNAANEKRGRDVYRFFRDELGAKWMQFIPIVERATRETLAIANEGWSGKGGRRLLYTQTGGKRRDVLVGAVNDSHQPHRSRALKRVRLPTSLRARRRRRPRQPIVLGR